MNVKVTQFGTTYQLTFFKDEILSVNCYLVEDEDGLTLIDTGIPEAHMGIIEAASHY